MGGADRILRIAIAIVIAILFWQGLISGILGYLLLGLAAIFLLTSLISICPLYTLFRIRTCRR